MGSALMTTRARKTPGRVAFVGSGPGDAGLLTVRATELLARAELVVTDPDGADRGDRPGRGRRVRPAVGEAGRPSAKDLVKRGPHTDAWVRLVRG